MNADLHCHTRASDGALDALTLVERAANRGVEMLAITDHDDVSALAGVAEACRTRGLRFVPGVEISACWKGMSIHVLGLGLDTESAELLATLAKIRSSRLERGARISELLGAVGIEGAHEGALRLCGNPNSLCRSHFAQYLVAEKYCGDFGSAFREYLGTGAPAFVEPVGIPLPICLETILSAKGIAVLAHPDRYAQADETLTDLLRDFTRWGGQAMEVVTGSNSIRDARRNARLARQFGLLASRGSDFHAPTRHGPDLGGLPRIPEEMTPVWSSWL